MNSDVQTYMDEVKREMKRSGDSSLKFFRVFEQEVASFLAENPEAGAADVERFFGSPNAVVSDYLENLPEEELKKRLRIRQRTFTIIRITAISLALILALIAAIFVYDNHVFTRGEKVNEGVSEVLPEPQSDAYKSF